jgi:GTP-binding protein HflX
LEKIRDTLRVKKERAILIGAILRGRDEGDDLTELVSLAESAGAIVVDRYQQKVHKINPSTYIGKGKVTELAERVKRFEADVIIFDNDLSPGQIRVIEEIVNVKVIDRSELILDIFATRAKTQQAKLQVEVAQLEYTYPRLTRMWSHLDALAGAGGATGAGAVGAIGTRGPGEQQLETDRRLVKDRVRDLKHELENIDSRRIREITGRQGLFKICLVGYTNTGKSTLLNKLTNADAYVEDKLFATLDTQTKKWTPVSGVEILLSDTVGFVRKLPHQLVASFKATLEEAVYADLLLHIIDAANPDAMKQIESVEKVLAEIGCGEKPTLKVFNKVDAVKKISEIETLQTLFPDALCISAKTGFGLEQLAEIAAAKYKGGKITVQVRISQSNGKAQSYLRACGTILKETYSDNSVIIEAVLGQNQLPGLKRLAPEKLKIID